MNESTLPVRAVIAELGEAVRRDHRRRSRRRRALRGGGMSVLAVAGLSTAALAAEGAFREVETVTPVGEVELPQHVTIQAVESFPEFVGRATSNGFVTRSGDARWGHYLYHVTGGEARDLGCGFAGPPTNNIYITSKRPLSEQEILALLEPDGELKPMVGANGQREAGTERPPWITSTSDGCPNPGIAGQPGTPDESPRPGKAAVATPTSKSTHILIRKTTRVPLAPRSSTTPSSGAEASPPPETSG